MEHPIGEMSASEVISQPSILMVEHALNGGVQKHVRDLVALFRGRAQLMTLRPVPGGLLRLSHKIASAPSPLYFDEKRELTALRRYLNALGLSRIHYHHLIQMPWSIARLPSELDIPYDFTAHDYFAFCPQITLTTERFEYCGEPAEAGCNRCLAIRPTPQGESIESWRERYRPFVEGAARVFAPCPSVIERLKKHFPNASLVLASHPEGTPGEHSRAQRWLHHGKEPLRILVLGALNPTKGPDLLEGCALDASERSLPIEFHLLGSAYRSLIARPDSALFVHGPYQDKDLDNLIAALSPHLVWFPARWPETYSYTLSAAVRQGLPVVAPNFGAFRDRLAGRPLSWLVPWDSNPSDLNDLFVLLRSDVSAGREFLLAGQTQRENFSYQSDYLLASDRIRFRSPLPGKALRKHTRAWRFSMQYVREYSMFLAHRALRFAYKLPGVRRVITSLMPEHRVQLIRRRLGKY